jgi:hypothetical protein
MKEDRVIRKIAYHPLLFSKRVMEDDNDERPIRIRYFGCFVLKSKKSKERSRKFSYIYRHYEDFKGLVAEFGYDVSTEEEFQSSLRHHFSGKKIRFIDDIYEKGLVLKQNI